MFGLELAPVVRSMVAPSTLSGSMISYIAPSAASSPKRIVPHGVTRTGSLSSMPLTIVVASPVSRSIFWSPGSVVPSSLTAMRYVGDDCGQSTIWSRFGAAFPAETTFAFRPFASVTRPPGSASAWASSRSAVDDASSGLLTPKSCSECAARLLLRSARRSRWTAAARRPRRSRAAAQRRSRPTRFVFRIGGSSPS